MESLERFFKVLGDSSRLKILEILKDNKFSLAQIVDNIGRSQATVSQHLKTLINAKLIKFEIKSKEQWSTKYYTIKYPEVNKIIYRVNGFLKNLENDEIDEKMKRQLEKERKDLLKI